MAGKNHNFNGRSASISQVHCTKCGLILLKNPASRKAANKPCESAFDAELLKKSQLERINWVK